MPVPNVDNNHSAESLAFLTSMFAGKPNIAAILNAFSAQIQKLEDAAWTLIEGRILVNATGVTLDKIGKIVGQARNGLSDAQYKQTIALRIRTNRSEGLSEDLIQITTIFIGLVGGVFLGYNDYIFAGFVIDLVGVPDPTQLAPFVTQGRSTGTYGNVNYTVEHPASVSQLGGAGSGLGELILGYTPPVPPAMILGSTYGIVPSAGLLATAHSGSLTFSPAVLAASIPV